MTLTKADLRLRSRKQAQQGISLLMIAVCSVVLLGMLGLAVDLSRAYIIKSELQAFADAAANAAAYELDGTNAGLTRANSVATSGPTAGGATANQYNFSTHTVTDLTVGFSTTPGSYQPLGSASVNSRFVQVTARGNESLSFLQVLPSVSSTLALNAVAAAGQGLQSSVGESSDPFSPDAHTPSDPNFGFTVGQQYTLKWPPPGQRGKAGNTCSGDGSYVPPNPSADRGYIDVGQGNGNSALTNAIVDKQYYLTYPYSVGSTIDWVTGNKNVGPAMTTRFNQDTDNTATTYSAYQGNGRRLLIVPVNAANDPATVAGFALFFMPAGICGPKNTSPCCGEYVGPALLGSAHRAVGGGSSGAGSSAGLYAVKLFQ